MATAKKAVKKSAVKKVNTAKKTTSATRKEVEKEVKKLVVKAAVSKNAKEDIREITNTAMKLDKLTKAIDAKDKVSTKPKGLVKPDANPARPVSVDVRGRQVIVPSSKKTVKPNTPKSKVPSVSDTASLFEKTLAKEEPNVTVFSSVGRETVSMPTYHKPTTFSPTKPPSISKTPTEPSTEKVSLSVAAAALRSLQSSTPQMPNFGVLKTR